MSEFGWVASVIFLRILQAALTGREERAFRCWEAWLAPLTGVPLLIFYCTYGDILSNLIWCGMMIVLSYGSIRGACIRGKADRAGAEAAVFPHRDLVLRRLGIPALDGGLLLAEYVSVQSDLLV